MFFIFFSMTLESVFGLILLEYSKVAKHMSSSMHVISHFFVNPKIFSRIKKLSFLQINQIDNSRLVRW